MCEDGHCCSQQTCDPFHFMKQVFDGVQLFSERIYEFRHIYCLHLKSFSMLLLF